MAYNTVAAFVTAELAAQGVTNPTIVADTIAVWEDQNVTLAALMLQYSELAASTKAEFLLGGPTVVPSAATVSLYGTASRLVEISGTTTITSFGTVPTAEQSPVRIWRCRATGIFTITHGAALECIGDVNVLTAAGDTFEIEAVPESNKWRMRNYQRKSGTTAGAQASNAWLTSIAAAGSGQIPFPATQVPSADPNTLDDYEEGTWTPSIDFAGAAVGITYGARGGTYTKVGRLVQVTMNCTLTNKGSSTGHVRINGFPFSIGNVHHLPCYGGPFTVNTAILGQSGGSLLFVVHADGASLFDSSRVQNTSSFYTSGCYNI